MQRHSEQRHQILPTKRNTAWQGGGNRYDRVESLARQFSGLALRLTALVAVKILRGACTPNGQRQQQLRSPPARRQRSYLIPAISYC